MKTGAVTIARSIYEDQAFDRMPELVELLRPEAGSTELMAHLTEPRPHIRGCWCAGSDLGRSVSLGPGNLIPWRGEW